MINVELLYSDLTRRKTGLDRIGQLPKDKVLFILIEDDEKEGKRKNITSCFGFDHYALCQKRDKSQDWVMLFGWDEGDFVWRSTTSREVVSAPIGVMHVVFHGVNVPQDVWKAAEKIFNEEM